MAFNYLILDLETYGKKTYKRFCNPLDSNHYVIANAYLERGGAACVDYDIGGIPPENMFSNIDLSKIDVIVGQNFKFDMLWFWGNPKFQTWLKNGGQIWDTLQAEYLLRGQQGQSPGKQSLSLDALSIKYGGTVKDSGVKEIFANGGTVLDIPETQLVEYAKFDVINTGIIFEKQLMKAKKVGLLPLIKLYNRHLLAITEMEYNGMYFDVPAAKEMETSLTAKVESLVEELHGMLERQDLWPSQLVDFNLGSSAHLALLLFGGNITVTQSAPMVDAYGNTVLFKSGAKKGEVRTKLEKVDVYIPGLGEPFIPDWLTAAGKKGTGVDVLKALKNITTNERTSRVVGHILKYRKYLKLLSTYIYFKRGKTESGLLPLIHEDGCIHSEYKTTQTETGRLSSTNPNLQNVPPQIAPLFISRFEDGVILEVDFSQLEVIVQAYITQSKNMITDIAAGVDFHCLRLGYAEDVPYEEVVERCKTDEAWKLKRKKAKIVSFQKAYGAHSTKIANETGLGEDVVETIFAKEDQRYPEINEFYEALVEELDSKKRATGMPLSVKCGDTYKDHPVFRLPTAQYQSITGKYYTFFQKACNTKRGLFRYWPMPNVMNYPVQGTAADIVATQVGEVFTFLQEHRDKCLMINEVHDSLILDVKKEHLDWTIKHVCTILKDVKKTFKTHLGLEFNVPLDVDYEYGRGWKS